MDRKGNLIFAVLSAVLLLRGAISTESTSETTAATTPPTTTTATASTTTAIPTEGTTNSSETTAPTTTANHSTTTEAETTETPTTTAEQTTQTPWPTFGSYQYFLSETSETELNFDAAEKDCIAWGGNLVSIYNETENDFIKSSVTLNYNGTAWIGLQQINGGYNWTDGSTFDFTNNLEVPDSNNTDSNNTDSGATQCFALNTTDDSNWFNVSCETTQPAFLCKRFIASTETPTEVPSNHPLNPAGLSHTAIILIVCAVLVAGVAFSLGGVWFIYKRKSRRRAAGNFSLIDNDALGGGGDDEYMDN